MGWPAAGAVPAALPWVDVCLVKEVRVIHYIHAPYVEAYQVLGKRAGVVKVADKSALQFETHLGGVA